MIVEMDRVVMRDGTLRRTLMDESGPLLLVLVVSSNTPASFE